MDEQKGTVAKRPMGSQHVSTFHIYGTFQVPQLQKELERVQTEIIVMRSCVFGIKRHTDEGRSRTATKQVATLLPLLHLTRHIIK